MADDRLNRMIGMEMGMQDSYTAVHARQLVRIRDYGILARVRKG